MLALLRINNLALVDSLIWEPQAGFLCITGETGAGKSVIIGAIQLVLGERADKSLIRSGESTCTVESVFTLEPQSPIHALLANAGIPACEDAQLLIRRIISSNTNKQFINDAPCTLALLRDIGAHLVDLHGPEDHHSLTSPQRQLSLLDAYGNHAQNRAEYSAAYATWHAVQAEWQSLRDAQTATDAEISLLVYTIQEITEADFTAEEISTLEERWQRAKNAAKLQETAAKALSFFADDTAESLTQQVRELTRAISDIERLDPSTAPLFESLSTVTSELYELESHLHDYLQNLDADPANTATLESRIDLLDSLRRKYGTHIDDINATLAQAQTRLGNIQHRDSKLTELQSRAEQAHQQAIALAAHLTKARKVANPKLAKDILHHIQELGFTQALFTIEQTPSQNLGPTGAETIDFLFSPNQGEPTKPLRLIASSGEMARMMLGIKSALADKDSTPLLVFDEIDANVGGEIATAVGKKMQALGAKHQVISITHFPQVAASATYHYLVQKSTAQGRTITSLNLVNGESRIDELVRMLGGGGGHARAHAQELLR